jgi:hypothetical protein
MKKKLCKISKSNFNKNKERILELVIPAKYICEDCLRVAKSDNNLCSALSIKTKD